MAAPPVHLLPPGGLLEIVFSFDTTGSMSSILEEVQGRLQDMIQRLQADIPGIRIGVIAHGDYCDKDVFYLTKQLDLSQNVAELCNFVKGVEGTGGGDPDECYELILRMVRQNFSWSPMSQKILVMIGDANPHGPDYELNVDNIDWKDEVNNLARSGVKIYGVQVFENEGVDEFYKTLASETDGHYLKLGEFSNICDFLMAICYRERGDDLFTGYEVEVRSRYGTAGIHKDLEGLFGALRRTDSTNSSASQKVTSSVPTAAIIPTVATPITTKTTYPGKMKTPKRVRGDCKDRTASLKRNKNITKSSKDTGLQLREKVPQTCFSCRNLKWSTWKKAYIPNNDSNTNFEQYTQCNRGKCMRKNLLFSDKSRKTALYEVSVQTKSRGKRHVMYSKNIEGKMDNTEWERKILSGGIRRLQRQIHHVVSDGCTVYVRRALVAKKQLPVLNTLKSYSYAWQKQKDTKSQRYVQRDLVTISGESMEE